MERESDHGAGGPGLPISRCRVPGEPSVSLTNARAAAPVGVLPTAESLGHQLRAALPPMRLHSVSLCNADGEVLWLSEGALGPDEHSVVLEALEALAARPPQSCYERALEDGRAVMCLAVRAPRGDLVGLAMVLADAKSLAAGLGARLALQARAILQRFAVLLSPQGAATTMRLQVPSVAEPSPLAEELLPEKLADEILTLDFEPAAPAADRPPPAAAAPEEATRIAPPLEFENDLVLHVQQLLKLRSGGRTRRYEVLARSRRDPGRSAPPEPIAASMAGARGGGALDAIVVRRLLTWLGTHRVVWESEPASFTINLSLGALEEEDFGRLVADCLRASGVPAESIGFEIRETACSSHRAQLERFLAACEQLGCFVVLDDFSLHSAAVPLLRSRALRVVKIDAALTGGAMKDKVSQALVVAIAQAAKVLGIHCVAKRVESQTARQWLAAIGCDFAQGFALEDPQPLESLVAHEGAQRPRRGSGSA